MKRNTDLGLLILRVGVSVLMLLHGIAKLFSGLGGIKYLLAQAGLPDFMAYGVLVGEVVAPLLILIGWRTRPAALVLAGNCLVAMLLAHSGQIFTLSEQGGWAVELLGLYLIPSLALMFTGAGKYALSSTHKWD
ncbi:DoxX family protein [Porphyromonas loveana]|uniref:Putative oxidoreductase n=1 Tax=Porphyromonas loveana TaxID=1884669 RepID=A0A2U1FH90_9PORP|nr:DoxX family protein [Porphyromonas loveana]PVZ11561.1 putative oxidoreductase [Porphyromonas loveana]